MRSRSDLPTLAVVARRSAWPAAAARIAEPFGARRVALRVPPRAPRTTLAMRQGMATTLPWLVEPAPALSWVEREGPRRWLNVAVAAASLVLTLPLMAVIAALVKLTSHGPVFYRQPRVGVDRRALSCSATASRRTRSRTSSHVRRRSPSTTAVRAGNAAALRSRNESGVSRDRWTGSAIRG